MKSTNPHHRKEGLNRVRAANQLFAMAIICVGMVAAVFAREPVLAVVLMAISLVLAFAAWRKRTRLKEVAK